MHFANTLSVIDALIDDEKYVEVIALFRDVAMATDPAARRVLLNRVTKFFLDNL